MKKNKKIVHYDKGSDVLYLGVRSGMEEEFVEIAPGISIELDDNKNVIGVEVLNASKVFSPAIKPMQKVLQGV